VNDGGRLRAWHFLLLAVLLTLPGFAVYRELGAIATGYVAGWSTAVSLFTCLIYGWDKRRAREQERREPERMLHLLEFIGGWPGAFLAQRRLRHKSSKPAYQFVFWLIILIYQFVAVESLRGWPVTRRWLRPG
jgi:uncharacterized membrane protein YsdA (DUF1294 family)